MESSRVSAVAPSYQLATPSAEELSPRTTGSSGNSLYESAKAVGQYYEEVCGGRKQYCLPPRIASLVAKPLALLGKAEDVLFGVRDVLQAHERDEREGTHGEHTLRASFKSVAKIGTTGLIWTAGAAVAATVSFPVAIGVSGVAFAASLIVPDKVAGVVGWLLGER